ncbi:unnamed protein product [Brugia timori]|uniref:EF-hand domain-containing protein n=1 Tax=Brugia timori TaxID=42155 RepID=A0A0R3QPU3_9BILA|nr:unnamed protein product [Brugia timori]
MMVDIFLEENEKSSPSSLVLQNGDVLLTEQAREMFSLCDHNGKGFVVKMDLARINGMIPSISQRQLELFFDNADIFKTNYITENQFINNISKFTLSSDSINVLMNELFKFSSNNAIFLDVRWSFIFFNKNSVDITYTYIAEPILLRTAFSDSQLIKTKICFSFPQYIN